MEEYCVMETNFSLEENKSKYHKAVVSFLLKEFPLCSIAQEFTIKIDYKILFIDIVIQSPIKIAIEISPEHHRKFVKFFHGTIAKFIECQNNDELKKIWCEMNSYLYIILKESDFKKDELYKRKLLEVLK